MTRKKSALGCRVLSIVLSLLMILCAVPLVSFAANGEDAGPVLEKSREDVFSIKLLDPSVESRIQWAPSSAIVQLTKLV